MIDNIELIKPLLTFENEDEFYMLYIFKRKKDQSTDKANHQSVRTIKTYIVSSVEYLEERYEEIKMLCEVFKARAYIHVQKQTHKDVSLEMMVELAHRIRSNQHKQMGLFESIVGQIKTLEKRWIVDIDTKEENYLNNIKLHIDNCRPQGKNKIITEIPTKNGIHLITKKFDVMKFKENYPDVEIVKKNPTVLYIPNSLY